MTLPGRGAEAAAPQRAASSRPYGCGGNRGLAGRQVGDPYDAHPIGNVFISF